MAKARRSSNLGRHFSPRTLFTRFHGVRLNLLRRCLIGERGKLLRITINCRTKLRLRIGENRFPFDNNSLASRIGWFASREGTIGLRIYIYEANNNRPSKFRDRLLCIKNGARLDYSFIRTRDEPLFLIEDSDNWISMIYLYPDFTLYFHCTFSFVVIEAMISSSNKRLVTIYRIRYWKISFQWISLAYEDIQ